MFVVLHESSSTSLDIYSDLRTFPGSALRHLPKSYRPNILSIWSPRHASTSSSKGISPSQTMSAVAIAMTCIAINSTARHRIVPYGWLSDEKIISATWWKTSKRSQNRLHHEIVVWGEGGAEGHSLRIEHPLQHTHTTQCSHCCSG